MRASERPCATSPRTKVEWTVEDPQSPKVSTRWSDREIWALATRQHGIIENTQLVALGVPQRTIGRWLASGRLRQVHRGVYMVGHGALSQRAWWMAAVLACGEGAALSHRCATRHHELIAWHPGRPAVSVPAQRRSRPPGIAVHRIQHLEPVVVEAIPVTSVARTIVDMAAISRRRTLEKVIEEAHVREVFDLRAIHEVLDQIARPRGVRVLRSVLDTFRPGTTLTKSGLEEAMLALCDRAGLPRPVVNGHIALLDGRLVEVDFHWPRYHVVVETHSNRYHATHPKRRRDQAKLRALQLAGWLALPIPEEDLAERPHLVLADLRDALTRPRDLRVDS